METVRVEGMEREYVIEMLQEHLVEHASRFGIPSVDEMGIIASRLHGHPYITKLASVVLEESPACEVIEKLYSRVETRPFVIGRLLGRIHLSDREQKFLEFASVLRVSVPSEAFAFMGGASSHSLLQELLDRFLLVSESGNYRLHPVLTEFFSTGLQDSEHLRRLHKQAYDYFNKLLRHRSLTVDERVEYVFHGVSCGESIDLRFMQAFAGAVRSALFEGVRNRDWVAVENASTQLLAVWPYEPIGHMGMAIALEGSRRGHEAEPYLASLDQVTRETLWLGIEFVKSRIRRRDFQGAERTLAAISQRYSDVPQVILTQAQLYERQGETDEAIQACEHVLSAKGVREQEAFHTGLILRDANRLDVLVQFVDTVYQVPLKNTGLIRLYGLGCVVTNHDPQEGLRLLSEMWDASPNDGYVIADYSVALRAVGRLGDARAVLDRGLTQVRRSNQRRPILEALAEYFEKLERYSEAFPVYRELVASWQNHLHLLRRFCKCLLDAAAYYRGNGESAREDSAVSEARSSLKRLLQIAPLDKWAADALHRTEHRLY